MKFKFDEKAVQRLVQRAVDKMAKEYNQDFELLLRRYQGKPIEQIKPALRNVFEKRGGKLTDPELTKYAQEIRDGKLITFRS